MNGTKFVCIDGFGEELDEILYEGISNWFISFRSVFTVYKAHFSYVLIFFSTIFCGILSYRHSVENGKKYSQFWWGALVHGLLSESRLTAAKYWHAQAPVMFFGKQLPLHLVFLYPSILYVSMMAVHRLRLNVCTEPAAVGIIAMCMEIPFRMISVKFLHITYHDSDPLYCQKLSGVPWVEIFSSLVFASSYVAVYHLVKFAQRRDMTTVWDKTDPDRKDILGTIVSGVSSPIVGSLQKILVLHLLQDFFNINPVSSLFFAVSLYLSFVVCFDPKKLERQPLKETSCKTYLFYQIFLYNLCFIYLALFGQPQNEISIGTHEPTGDCTMLICSRTPWGRPVKRKKYLCVDEVASRKSFVYNFDCLEEGPPCLHAIWYTICGAPVYYRPQFFLNVLSFALLLFAFYTKAIFKDIEFGQMIQDFISKIREEYRLRITQAASPEQQSFPSGQPQFGQQPSRSALSNRPTQQGTQRSQQALQEQPPQESMVPALDEFPQEEVTVGFILMKNDASFSCRQFEKSKQKSSHF